MEVVSQILLIGLTQVCNDRKQQVEQKDMKGSVRKEQE